MGTRPSSWASSPPTVSTSSASTVTPNSSSSSVTGSRAVTRAVPGASHSTGARSLSYSSMTIATWIRMLCICRSSSSTGLLSGT